ncbi:MAG: hypothetical protein Q9217_005833 [Psora testacea]
MKRSTTDQSATRANPIHPPALEFPFPQTNVESSAVPSTDNAALNKHSKTFPQSNDAQNKSPATPALQKLSDKSRPRPVRPLSERPVLAQRRSVLGVRRGKTTFAPTALTDAIGESTSGSDSSDDEVHNLESRPSHLLSRSFSNRGLNKILSPKRSHSRRRASHDRYSRFSVGNDKFKTKGNVSKRDGRLNISVNETANRGYLAHALGASLKHHLMKPGEHDDPAKTWQIKSIIGPREEKKTRRPDFNARLTAVSTDPSFEEAAPIPTLNVVIMVIGSRGDIQPFLKVGKLLKEKYGHRVRIATHPAFKKFTEQDSGLEFFSIGGDPAELMAFMVKNPGLIPSVSTVRAGEIGRRRDSMFEMFQGLWRACINVTDEEHDVSNRRMMDDRHLFVADAIIANPPCFAHVHCAERLGVPLHLMFTFPYSPTQQFPHPLANIKKSNVDTNYINFMSYPLVEMMTWQGLGDLVNRFRVKTLGLEPVSTLWAPGQLYRLKVPYTYMWSPGLIPKPEDWGPEIEVAGFVFLDLASSFKPPETLTKFLDAGEPPVYIGFGSIVVDDPDKFTALIFEAVQKAGVRALVSKGWGGLGDQGNTPNDVFMLENTPHDWLFPRVSAVVHHGGAGTTAIGLKCGKPTMIVPFFGDQPFWGAMVAKAGAGAREAIPYKRLTADALASGIKQCLALEAKEAAQKIAQSIAEEGDGANNAIESFLRHLPMRGEHSMRCSILPDHVAVWTLKDSNLRLSALAAELLVQGKKIRYQDLQLLRHYEWNDFEGPGEPLTGAGAAIVKSAGGVVKGVGGLPMQWAKSIKKEKQKQKKAKSSRAARKDNESEPSRKIDVQENRTAVNPGSLSHGGHHGVEKDLPSPHSLLGRAHDGLIHRKRFRNGGVLSPAPRNPADDERPSPSALSEDTEDNLARDLAAETGIGLAQAGEALAKVPMDLSLAIAQGFHNAPRLYGDDTVRTAPRVTGIQSGLRAAGSELMLGLYDGITGLFLQPYNGARDRGAVGFIQGVGKGIGGFVLKDLAAIVSPFGYTLKGIHKELTKGRQPTAFIRQARIIQGAKDMRAMDHVTKNREMVKVDTAWQIVGEIRAEVESCKQEGVKGRIAVLRERRKLDKMGAFENVGHAKKALEVKQEERRGRDSVALASCSGEERRRAKFIAKVNSFPKSPAKGIETEMTGKEGELDRAPKQTEEKTVKGAERQVTEQVANPGKERPPINGALETNGTATVGPLMLFDKELVLLVGAVLVRMVVLLCDVVLALRDVVLARDAAPERDVALLSGEVLVEKPVLLEPGQLVGRTIGMPT